MPNTDYPFKKTIKKHVSTLFVGILALALGFMAGEAVKLPMNSTSQSSVATRCPQVSVQPLKGANDEGCQVVLDSARKALVARFPMFRDASVNQLQKAVIKSIDGQKLSVEFDASALDFLKYGMVTKIAILTDKTTFERHSQKPLKQFAREMDQFGIDNQAYQELAAQATDRSTLPKHPIFPLPFFSENITMADLKPGDTVTVQTSSDIRTSDSFEAESVIVEPQPAIGAAGSNPPTP
jgi:hypothetical protein